MPTAPVAFYMLPDQTDLTCNGSGDAVDAPAQSHFLVMLATMLGHDGDDAASFLDLTDLACLEDIAPAKVLERLLQSTQPVRCMARVRPPRRNALDRQKWLRQQGVMTKLHELASGATATESPLLFVGFPILQIRWSAQQNVAAPIAFIPVALTVWDEALEIRRRNDRPLVINPDLMVCLQLFGPSMPPTPQERDPLGSIGHWIDRLSQLIPTLRGTEVPRSPIDLQSARGMHDSATEAEIHCAAQLGRFPIARQGQEIGHVPQGPDLFAEIPPPQRLEIAERLSELLISVDPVVLNQWAIATPAQVRNAKQSLDDLPQAMAIFRAGPLDEQLRAESVGRTLHAEHLTPQSKMLRRYGQAYREASGILAALQAQAPDISLMVLAKWASWNEPMRQQKLRRLRMMGSMARAIEAQPLDRQFTSHLRRQPLTSQQVNDHLTVLQDYLESKTTLLGWMPSALRRDATAATAYFDEKLSPASAEKVRAFLHGVRLRIDFVAELQNELEESPGSLPSDEELLRLFGDHGTAASLVMNAPLPITGSAELPSMAVHRLMTSQDCSAAEILHEWNLPPGAVPADRLATFLARLAARLQLIEWWNQLQPDNNREDFPADSTLERALRSHQQCLEFLSAIVEDTAWPILRRPITHAMRNQAIGLRVIQTLRHIPGDISAEAK